MVVDGLDFFELETEILLHREAGRRGQLICACQGVAEITTATCFDPDRPALEDMVCEEGRPSIAKAISSFFPVLPKATTPELLAQAIAGELPFLPSDVTAAAFGAGFLIDDILRTAVRRLPPHAVAPDLYVLNEDDLWLRFWDARHGVWSSR